MSTAKQITTLRLPQDILDRADALVPTVRQMPDMGAGGEVTRSTVLRLALLRGLDELEILEQESRRARTRRR